MEKSRAGFLPLLGHGDRSHRTRDRKRSTHAHGGESLGQNPVDLKVSVSFKIPWCFPFQSLHTGKGPQVILLPFFAMDSEPESQKRKTFGGRIWLARDSRQ